MSLPESILEGKYDLVRPISEGGMGRVYLVRHRHLDEMRVIKVIRRQHAEDADLQKRFLLEARAAIRLRHPNIAETYDFSLAEDGTACIVMEFIEGKTLQEILADGGPPPLDLTYEIALQLLDGLEFLHRRGFVHRDIAPDNVMLGRDFDGNPTIKLIDLGIAKRIGEEAGAGMTAAGMFLGKARYSAPEQFGRGEVDQRSDLYSFGVLLYELLTGVCPIRGESLSELISAHLFGEPADFDQTDTNSRVSDEMRSLVLQTLAKLPSERFASAKACGEALRRVCESPQRPLRAVDLESILADRPDSGNIAFEPTQPMTTPQHPQDPSLIPRELLQARQRIEEGQLTEARSLLRGFLEQYPSHEHGSDLLLTVESQLEDAERAREGVLTQQADRIQQLLDDGSLDQAQEELQRAVAEHGEAELFRRLAARLEGALAEREEQIRQAQARRVEEERQQQIAEREASIRQKLEAGRLEEADKSLVAAMRDLGEAPVWDELLHEVERLAKARRQLKRHAGKRLEEAERELEAGDWKTAAEFAEEARRLDDSQMARAVLGRVELARREDQARRERERLQSAKVAAVEWKLAAGDFEEASSLLKESGNLFQGCEERLASLEEQIDFQRRETEAAAIDELLARARQYREEQDYEESIKALRQALSMDPEHEKAHVLLIKVESEFETWVLAKAREAARRQGIEEMVRLVEEGQLEKARAAYLALSAEEESIDDDLKQAYELLQKAERDAENERERQVVELLQSAQIHLEQQEFEEALVRVQRALELDPDSLGLRELLQEIESACQEALSRQETAEKRRTSAQAEVATKISSLLELGQVGIAGQLLEAAERDYGEAPFRSLRDLLNLQKSKDQH